jgi:hypothetical protein
MEEGAFISNQNIYKDNTQRGISPSKLSKNNNKSLVQATTPKYEHLTKQIEWYKKNCNVHPPKDILKDNRFSVRGMSLVEFLIYVIPNFNKASLLIENVMEPGYVYEALWNLVILFGVCDIFPLNAYRLQDGNINKGVSQLRQINDVFDYISNDGGNPRKVISGNSSGVSDITLRRITKTQKKNVCNQNYEKHKNEDWVLISSKFYKHEKATDKYDTQKLHSIILSDVGFSAVLNDLEDTYEQASQEISKEQTKTIPRLVLFVHHKIGLYEKIQKSRRSSKYLLYGLDKDKDIYDLEDLDFYYSKLNQLLFQNDFDLKNISKQISQGKTGLVLRFHQELILEKSLKSVQKNPEILWGCVPRSGKTYLIGGFYKRWMDKNKKSTNGLILTPAPNETMEEYRKLFSSYTDFENVDFVQLTSDKTGFLFGNKPFDKEKNYVFASSKQFLDYQENENKEDILQSQKNLKQFLKKVESLDIVFYDENHLGGTSNLSMKMLDDLRKKYPNIIIIYITATYNKTQFRYPIPSENIFEWTMQDIALMKDIDKMDIKINKNEQEFLSNEDGRGEIQSQEEKEFLEIIEDEEILNQSDEQVFLSSKRFINKKLLEKRHGKKYVDNAFKVLFEQGITLASIKIEYQKYPEIYVLTQSFMSENVKNLLSNNDNQTFSMSEIFEIESSRDSYYFKNEIYVKNVLDIIAGSKEEPTKQQNFFKRVKDISKRLESRTTLDSQNFTSQIWFLPSGGKGSNIIELLNLLLPLMKRHPILKNFEILSVKDKECESDLKSCIAKSEERGKQNGKTGLIILTGKQISLGISLPCVDMVIMLNDEQSFDWNYQRMFRSLTESEGKKIGFVIDFLPSRILSTFYGYTDMKRKEIVNMGDKITDPRESNLIFVDYDIFREEQVDNQKVNEIIQDMMRKIEMDSTLSDEFKKWNKEIMLINIPPNFVKNIQMNIRKDIGFKDTFQGKKRKIKESAEELFGKSEKTEDITDMESDNKQNEDQMKVPSTSDKQEVGVEDIKRFLFSLVLLLIFLTFPYHPKNLAEILEIIEISKENKKCEGNLYEAVKSRVSIWLSNVKNKEQKLNYIMDTLLNPEHFTQNILNLSDLRKLVNKMLEEFVDRLKEMNQETSDANIFNKGELLELIEQRLSPRKKEREKHGEVFTPLWLCDKMINKLPNSLVTNPNVKILGQSVGMGNFQVSLYYKLMKNLENKITNEEKRRKHILENILYMVELNTDNKELLENVLNPERKYKLNIACGDYLEMDVLKMFNLKDGFDLIIENPPYNKGSVGSGNYIWDKFVRKGLEELKNEGYLNLITPPVWRKPDSEKSKNKGLYELMTSKNQMIYLEMYGLDEAKRIFDAGTRFDIYLIKKEKASKATKIIDLNHNKHELELWNYPFLPNHSIDKVFLLFGEEDEELVEVIYSASSYETRKGKRNNTISDKETSVYKYPLIKTIHKNESPIILYSSTNKNGMFGIPKVIFSDSGINDPFIDDKGKYGQTEHTIGLRISNLNEGKVLSKFIISNEFQNIINACIWSTFQIDWRLFTYFKKDFYTIPLEQLNKSGSPKVEKMGDNMTRYSPKKNIKSPSSKAVKSPRTLFRDMEEKKKSEEPIFDLDYDTDEELFLNLINKESKTLSPRRISDDVFPLKRRVKNTEGKKISITSPKKRSIGSPSPKRK